MCSFLFAHAVSNLCYLIFYQDKLLSIAFEQTLVEVKFVLCFIPILLVLYILLMLASWGIEMMGQKYQIC